MIRNLYELWCVWGSGELWCRVELKLSSEIEPDWNGHKMTQALIAMSWNSPSQSGRKNPLVKVKYVPRDVYRAGSLEEIRCHQTHIWVQLNQSKHILNNRYIIIYYIMAEIFHVWMNLDRYFLTSHTPSTSYNNTHKTTNTTRKIAYSVKPLQSLVCITCLNYV